MNKILLSTSVFAALTLMSMPGYAESMQIKNFSYDGTGCHTEVDALIISRGDYGIMDVILAGEYGAQKNSSITCTTVIDLEIPSNYRVGIDSIFLDYNYNLKGGRVETNVTYGLSTQKPSELRDVINSNGEIISSGSSGQAKRFHNKHFSWSECGGSEQFKLLLTSKVVGIDEDYLYSEFQIDDVFVQFTLEPC